MDTTRPEPPSEPLTSENLDGPGVSEEGSDPTPEHRRTSAEHRRSSAEHRRSSAEWLGLICLAGLVLLFGAFVYVFGPLLAISCTDCQDGVRGPLRFGGALLAVASYAVPLVTLGSLIALFTSRRGARAGAIGLGVLLLLLLTEQLLGGITA
ncbi:hypothetical protein [Streptomyces spirodelae]|uniref:Uncharacterized protein n=1 Tax=Streptomyces spirodelae TaxID=2812904 RepID=A0ABS3WXU1_9ACTN|nr:hypothetical protein [Streptomyces spirodelae]MBO8187954.1 hypothetical protein [Streptomyces spirodelae]